MPDTLNTPPQGPNPDQHQVSLKSHRTRRVVQILVFILFLYLLLGTRQEIKTILPHDLFFIFDPLAGIATILGGRNWIVPMVAGGIMFLVIGLFFGRFWCGWLCPMGTLIDWIPSRAPKTQKNAPGLWRFGKYLLLFTIIATAVVGSLTLVVLDPVTLLSRSLTSVLLPALNTVLALVASIFSVAFYSFEPAHSGLAWFDTHIRVRLFGESGFNPANLILLFVFAGVLVLNAVKPRAWCRYLCPLGALYGLVAKVSLFRYKVDNQKCTSCERCTLACPTGAIRPDRNYAADRSECIACLDCAAYCPTHAISFPFSGSRGHAIQSERRQFISTLALALIGAFVLRYSPSPNKKDPKLIRPPGSTEENVETKCIRCGECSRVCPTSAIQPVNSAQAWNTTWSPYLLLRHGYCDYSCSACGQVCPTGAIPKLALEEKRVQVIGTAVIDENRCIPFAENRECGICQKVCPLPIKAVTLKTEDWKAARPFVDKRLCTGCGICEYECPVQRDSAIRIFKSAAAAPTQEALLY